MKVETSGWRFGDVSFQPMVFGQGEGEHKSFLNSRPLTLTPNCRVLIMFPHRFWGRGDLPS